MKTKQLQKEWEEVELRNIVECLDGKRIPVTESDRTKGNIPYYGANGQVGWIDNFIFNEELLLIAEDGGGWGLNQKCTYIIKGKSWVNNHAHVLRIKKDKADIKFLMYWLNDSDLNKYISGTTRGKLNQKAMNSIKIPIPPLSVQKTIVQILEKAEQLKQKRALSDKLMDDYLKSVFNEMFLKDRSKTEFKGFLDVFNITTGKLDSNAMVEDGIYPFFTCSQETFRINNYAFDCEALLLAGNNAAGKYSVKHYNGKFNAYQRTYVLTLKNRKDNFMYLHFVLRNKLEELRHASIGTNTKYLTLGILKSIRIPLPSSELQQSFASIVQHIEKIKKSQKKSKQEINNLFNALMQKAFQGELIK